MSRIGDPFATDLKTFTRQFNRMNKELLPFQFAIFFVKRPETHWYSGYTNGFAAANRRINSDIFEYFRNGFERCRLSKIESFGFARHIDERKTAATK